MFRTLLSRVKRSIVAKRKPKSPDDRICTVPFEHFGVLPDGNVVLCCDTWMQGNIFVGNVYKQSFQEIWNSPVAKEIRESVTDGTFSRCTGKCPALVCNRLTRRKDVRFSLRDAVDNPTRDLPVHPTYIKLNNDCSCNLFCRSCRRERFMADSKTSDSIAETNMRVIYPLLEHAEILDMLGTGEALTSKACLKLLTSLDAKRHKHLQIHMLSNGMLLDEKGWERLKAIHELRVWLNISIDGGTKGTYENLRRGGDFDKLMSNLNFISQLRRSQRVERFNINVTVQKDNYRELPALAQIARDHLADRVVILRLVNWGSYTDEEYREADVSLASHPEHEQLLEVLADDSLYDIIDIGPFAGMKCKYDRRKASSIAA